MGPMAATRSRITAVLTLAALLSLSLAMAHPETISVSGTFDCR